MYPDVTQSLFHVETMPDFMLRLWFVSGLLTHSSRMRIEPSRVETWPGSYLGGGCQHRGAKIGRAWNGAKNGNDEHKRAWTS